VGEIRTPYWRRVICLRLADPEGGPVAWVHDWPRVSHGPSQFASRPRGDTPAEVLRSRPREGSAVGLGGGSGGPRTARSLPPTRAGCTRWCTRGASPRSL
jgi:hypothetical protein